MSRASIRRATGGYIVTVYGLLGGDELVFMTFDEAITQLYRSIHEEGLPIGQALVTQRVEGAAHGRE